MNAEQIDDLARILGRPSRRAVASLMLGGLLGGLGFSELAAKKRKKKKKCKKCGPCRKCKKGKCKPKPDGIACDGSCNVCQQGTCVPKPDDTSCEGVGKCLQGECNPLPTCIGSVQDCPANEEFCCSGSCTTYMGINACSIGGPGSPCYDSGDCYPQNCVGYRCQAD